MNTVKQKIWMMIFAGIFAGSFFFMTTCGGKDNTSDGYQVVTDEAGDITFSTAVSGGTITADGDVVVKERGVCWSAKSPPMVANSKTTDGEGTGSFKSKITGLQPGTTYYVRAYFYENRTVRYGNMVSFKTIDAPDEGGGISVSLVSDTKTITEAIVGLNTQCIKGPYWTEAAFKDAIADIDPGNFRYPGGTIGNFWDWETGDYLVGAHKPIGYLNNVPNIYKLDNVKEVYTRSGNRTEPIYMLNVLTSTYEHQKASLDHAKSIGLPVTYIELGNEFYLDGEDDGSAKEYMRILPSVKSYANLCRTWNAHLKRDFPGCKVAVLCVNTPLNWAATRTRVRIWNDSLRYYLTEADYDAITIHNYTKTGARAGVSITMYDMISQSINSHARDKIQDPSLGTTKPLWVTEYNFEAGVNQYPGQWVHGLSALLSSTQLALVPRVEFACFFNLAGDWKAATIYDRDYPAASSVQGVKKNNISATGYSLSILMQATKNATSIRSIDFSSNPTVATTKNGNMKTLYGYLFEGNNATKKALLINIGAEDQTVNISTLDISPSTVEQYRAEALSTFITPQTFLKETPDITEGALALKPYSVTLLR